jgi:small GTP-binding protein
MTDVRTVTPGDVYEADDQRYDDAMKALRDTIAQFDKNSPTEQVTLKEQYDELVGMSDKLENGHLHIAIFGQIDAGKTALVNAVVGRAVGKVSVIGGTTVEAAHFTWDGAPYRVPGFANSEVFIVDTPGISEINGEARAKIARAAAQRADLILFVTSGDLVDAELAAITDLATNQKPMILVFNKTDLYSASDRAEVKAILQERVQAIIAPEDVVLTAADPLERERIREMPDGTEISETYTPAPNITELVERMLAIFEREGKLLIALNSSLFTADRSDKLIATRLKLRDRPAFEHIVTFAVAKGVAVAANPIPLADIAGGVAVDATMIVSLAKMYGLQLTRKRALGLVAAITSSAGFVTIAEYATHLAANAINVATLGAGWLVTAVPQGVMAAFGSYVVGMAAREYFKHGSWGEGGPKAVVDRIMADMDKTSVLNMLRTRIQAQLATNRHATGAATA